MVQLSLSRITTASLFLSLPFVAACGLFDGLTSDEENDRHIDIWKFLNLVT